MAREVLLGGAIGFRSMRHRLRDGDTEYVLLEFHEPVPEGHEPLSLGDPLRAERRLSHFAQDHFNLRTLRELAHTHALGRTYEPLSEQQVVRQVATLLGQGRLRLARAPLEMVPGVMAPLEKVKPVPAPTPEEETHRLMLKVVDDVTDTPIAGIKLRVEIDGAKQQATTDDSGEIELSGLRTQARVKVTSVIDGATLEKTLAFVKSGVLPALQPGRKPRRRRSKAPADAFLARVLEHKVSDGDTLESIAKAHELTEEKLAKFNWGTADPDEIQRHLFVDVGCTSKDEGGKFVLSASDQPGILYVPRALEMDWVTLEQRHILRVKRVPEPRPFLFSV